MNLAKYDPGAVQVLGIRAGAACSFREFDFGDAGTFDNYFRGYFLLRRAAGEQDSC